MPVPFRRVVIPLAKLAILALVLWGGSRTISSALDDLRQRNWDLARLRPGWLVLSGLLYLASQLPSGLFWHNALKSLGQRVTTGRALRAYYIGHLGKYVPGKAMVVVLRAALMGRPHVKTSLAVVAVFYETFTTMAVGALLAAIIAALSGANIWLIGAAIGAAILVGLPTAPPVFSRLMRLLPVKSPQPEDPDHSPFHIPNSAVVIGWLTVAIGWLLAGASLWATVRAVGIENYFSVSQMPLYTATIALAVVFGFISMLPAGIGVRDLALMQLLAPHLDQFTDHNGPAMSLIAVIVLRLVWLAAEALLSAALYPLGRTPTPALEGPPQSG
jgi:glycosyltransferase 2 family protein